MIDTAYCLVAISYKPFDDMDGDKIKFKIKVQNNE